MMHDREKSNSAIGAEKPTNKAGSPAAESVEQRAGTKRNANEQSTHRSIAWGADVYWGSDFTFSQTKTDRPSRPSCGLLSGAAAIVRVFPSSLKNRTCSVPVQASFHEMST